MELGPYTLDLGPRILYFGPWTTVSGPKTSDLFSLDLGPSLNREPWTLNLVTCTLDIVPGTLYLGLWALGLRRWTLDLGPKTSDHLSLSLDLGAWILVLGGVLGPEDKFTKNLAKTVIEALGEKHPYLRIPDLEQDDWASFEEYAECLDSGLVDCTIEIV